VRQVLTDAGAPSIKIICKIESQAGLINFDDILAVADGIMVARGDLAMVRGGVWRGGALGGGGSRRSKRGGGREGRGGMSTVGCVKQVRKGTRAARLVTCSCGGCAVFFGQGCLQVSLRHVEVTPSIQCGEYCLAVKVSTCNNLPKKTHPLKCAHSKGPSGQGLATRERIVLGA
jgi:hypothetical protein